MRAIVKGGDFEDRSIFSKKGVNASMVSQDHIFKGFVLVMVGSLMYVCVFGSYLWERWDAVSSCSKIAKVVQEVLDEKLLVLGQKLKLTSGRIHSFSSHDVTSLVRVLNEFERLPSESSALLPFKSVRYLPPTSDDQVITQFGRMPLKSIKSAVERKLKGEGTPSLFIRGEELLYAWPVKNDMTQEIYGTLLLSFKKDAFLSALAREVSQSLKTQHPIHLCWKSDHSSAGQKPHMISLLFSSEKIILFVREKSFRQFVEENSAEISLKYNDPQN